jgi:predicted alpha/beta hydrolase family esterase
MRNVFIIHGSYGNPKENWIPCLKEELEKLGCKVFVPEFPTPENQNLKSWRNTFKNYEKYIRSDTVFIGHSLGPAFILNLLETHKAKAAFFVAGFIGLFTGKYADPKFDEVNKTFTERVFDWKSIKDNCKIFYVLYSDNDPYVPKEKANQLGKLLDTEPIVVKGAGHFNSKAGYTKFELLLEKLKPLL